MLRKLTFYLILFSVFPAYPASPAGWRQAGVFPFSGSAFAEVSKEQEAFSAAQKVFDGGFYDVSVTLFNRFLDNFPTSPLAPEVNFCLGQCYFHQKKYSEAIKALESAIDVKNTNVAQDKLFYWLAEAFFKNNDFSMAYHFYDKLVTLHPLSRYNRDSFYSLGWCLFEQGKFQEAKEKFSEFRNKFASDALSEEADVKIAECLYNLKNYAELKEYTAGILANEPRSRTQERVKKSALLKFYLAESCFYLEDYHCAIDNYRKVLESALDANLNALSCLGLGWCYLKQNTYSEAVVNFEKVIQSQMEKNVESALLGKALSLQMNAQYQEALDTYVKLIEQAKGSSFIFGAYMGKAESLYELKRYPESVAAYKEAINTARYADKEINGASLEKLKLGMGFAYLKSGDFKEALSEFLGLAQDAKDNKIKISSLTKLAEVYDELGDLPRAVGTYEKILKDYPDCDECDYARLNLGLVLFNAKHYVQAIEVFNKLIAEEPKSELTERASFYSGKAYYSLSDYLNSHQLLSYFTAEFPSSALRGEAFFLDGLCLKALERFQGAYESFKTALTYEQDPHLLAQVELQMSDCLYELGRKQEALERLEHLRSKYPDSEILSLVLYRLAEHYFELNQLDLCRRYLLELINSYPEASLLDDAYYLLAVCYEKEGRYDEAVVFFMKIKIGKEKVYPKLADAYKTMGKFQDALFYYRMALEENIDYKPLIQFKLAECLDESGAPEEALKEYKRISSDRSLMVKGMLRCGKIYEKRQDWQSAVEMYEKIAVLNAGESKFAAERIAVIKNEYLIRRNIE